ncbi:MAG: hypothetical protein KKB70_05305 [Proteobacteria bacterium]|nr:hypothetical protein [Pseudomonadota bacterium]MBU1611798.1 hypothetical protein [Pseudomonadota bacterium]
MKTRVAFITMFLLMLIASVAHAGVYTFEDTVNYWPGWANGTSDDSKDVIGVPNFTTGTVSYQNGGIMTGFSVNYTAGSAYNNLGSGDLFINVNNDNSWDYVVDLSGRNGGTVGVYAFNVDYDATGSYIMSTGSGIREDHPTGAIVSGAPVAYATWSGLETWQNSGQVLTTSIEGLNLDYEVLTVGYTVSCANDVVFAGGMSKTPIPGAV